MSADAKVWYDESVWLWQGCHDGECHLPARQHTQGETLVAALLDVEACLGGPCRWEFRRYQDNMIGLVGYRS